MNVNVLEKLRSLPPEKQQEVEDFVCFLAQKYALPQHSHEEVINGAARQADSNEMPEDY